MTDTKNDIFGSLDVQLFTYYIIMECEACSRPAGPRLAFHCTTCARNLLYQPRIDQASVLLEKEALGSQIAQAILEVQNGDASSANGVSRRHRVEAARTEKTQVDNQTNGISSHIEILRQETRSARQEISSRKAALTQRRQRMDAVTQMVKMRRNRYIATIRSDIAQKDQAWNAKAKRLEGHRAFLCREVAQLYGLKCKRRTRNRIIVEQYSIGGVVIPDLRDMNSTRPEELSAAIANIAHFLLLVSHYLAVRLPAEIIVPHRAWPRPSILTPSGSYTTRDVHFPGTTPSQSTSTSPTVSRHVDARSPPRPRPLYVDKRLPQLAQEDQTAHSLFIEAVSLLAWNIAWLCRSQGFSPGTDSWEDICCIGKNLYQLFGPSPPLTRVRSSRDITSRPKIAGNSNSSPRSRSLPRLGQYSHGSAHSFLANNEGMALIRGWKVTRYMTIADSLKRTLLEGISNAEWELLEEREWDDGGGEFNEAEAVFVKRRNDEANTAWDDARSVMTARMKVSTLNDGEDNNGNATARAKGTSGWTKVKSREKP